MKPLSAVLPHVLVLLSGGIDSPVAVSYFLRLGCHVSCVHFTTDVDKTGVVKQIWQTLATTVKPEQVESKTVHI